MPPDKRERPVSVVADEARSEDAAGGKLELTLAGQPVVEPVEMTMHDVIARALTPVVVPGGGRRSLPDTYQDRSRKVLKAVESLERLHRDARFRGDLQEIQDRNLPVVINHAAAKLNDIRDVLASDVAP